MLKFEKSKKNGGFTLWGDFYTLKHLHRFVMDLSEKSPALDEEGLAPAFGYDLRKAYDGMRETSKVPAGDQEIAIFGVEQVWTTFIAQVALFRTALAFVDSNKHEQSQMYLLEGFLEDALAGCLPDQSVKILQSYKALIGISEDDLYHILGSRTAYFLLLDARARKTQLAEVLMSMTPAWNEAQGGMGANKSSGLLTPKHFDGFSWDRVEDQEL